MGANLELSDLSFSDAKGANFKGAILKGANLSEVVVEGANFSATDLQNAQLYGVDMQQGKFDQANLKGVSFKKQESKTEKPIADLEKQNIPVLQVQ